MKILGYYNGHDASYAILENGMPIVHNELERFTRVKGCGGNAYDFFLENETEDALNIDHVATCYRTRPYDDVKPDDLNSPYTIIGHHQAHAANAYYSSPFNKAYILTIDGGGIDYINGELGNTSFGFWKGDANTLELIENQEAYEYNLGYLWSKFTKKVFKQGSGTEGTVMALAALGKPHYKDELIEFVKLGGRKRPVDEKFLDIAETKQGKYDIARSMQEASEFILKEKLSEYMEKYDIEHLCVSGGVSLNCIMIAKISEWFPSIKSVFCDPIPHDGGLSMGSARYVWHHELGNKKINSAENSRPYLGKTYSEEEVNAAIEPYTSKITTKKADLDQVVAFLKDEKIVSLFGGGSESGKRALGNRSIIADPRSNRMKDIINKKVKHRESFRPFAPSILKEDVTEWFEKDIDSPFMSFAINFKKDKAELVPAVVHFDGTGRLQTVSKEYNPFYHSLISEWKKATGVPIIVNTSFNDNEPIVENPVDAIKCFLKTNIDFLYFYDYQLLISKKTILQKLVNR